MNQASPTKQRRYLLGAGAAVAVGAAICAYLILTQPAPEEKPPSEPGRLVRVFRAERTPHRMAIETFGTSRAERTWTAIAEVRGRATEVHARFEPGELLPAGAVLVRIDPTDYELTVRRLDAELAAKRAQQRENLQTEANFQQIARLQQRQCELARAEYDRQEKLYQRGAVSLATLQAAEHAYVTALTAWQQTRNSLALLPIERELLEASILAVGAQRAQAARDLERCEIRLPGAARCAAKSVEIDQVVGAGQQLGTFLALDIAEVVAMVEPRKMPALFPEGVRQLGTLDLTQGERLDESLVRKLNVPAEVHWGLGDRGSVWYGRVARLAGSLDPGTRTAPVVVEVPDPYKDVTPGVRPPLVPDAFCRVVIYGDTVEDVVVIPRNALHGDRVYLLREGRLHIAPVEVLALEEETAVVRRGIAAGEMVVLTDLFPASEGMALRPSVVENPVRPRLEIDFPEEVFARLDVLLAAGNGPGEAAAVPAEPRGGAKQETAAPGAVEPPAVAEPGGGFEDGRGQREPMEPER